MSKQVPDLIRRQQALAATQAKFRGKRFGWKSGQHCAALLTSHLKAMGRKAPKVGALGSLLAAKRVLAARGWDGLAEAIDAQGLARIAPAEMLPGDVALRASADGIGAALICMTSTKMLGWFENEETGGRCVVMDMSFDQLDAAWRV